MSQRYQVIYRFIYDKRFNLNNNDVKKSIQAEIAQNESQI